MLIKMNELAEFFKAATSLITSASLLASVVIGAKGVNELDKTEDHIYEIRKEIDKMEDMQRIYQIHNIIAQNPAYPKQYGILSNEAQQNQQSKNMKQAASAPQSYQMKDLQDIAQKYDIIIQNPNETTQSIPSHNMK